MLSAIATNPPHLVDDRALREVRHHELAAVRTTVLAEIDHDPPAVPGGVGEIVAEIEERLAEPRGNVDRVRRGILRLRGSGKRGERQTGGRQDAIQRHYGGSVSGAPAADTAAPSAESKSVGTGNTIVDVLSPAM
jgi:hypothetical protein